MIALNYIYIPYGKFGLVFRDGRFDRLLRPGRHWVGSLFTRMKVLVAWETWDGQPWIQLSQDQLKQLKVAEELADVAGFIDLTDTQRALVWLDGRFHGILEPGLYGYWTGKVGVRVEVVDIRGIRLVHDEAQVILRNADAKRHLHVQEVADNTSAVAYVNGAFEAILGPGIYGYWKNGQTLRFVTFDLREQVLDVTGQEIMTADKVTLRMNAVLTYRVTDVRKAAESAADIGQVLYRELQLIVRAEVGGRTLDQLLADKAGVAEAALATIARKARAYGLEINGLGIRDIILPGDMKELLNQVIEAEKAAQANIIKRREETAAVRSQLNSAKLIEQNPVLMRLRELESLEKFADKANLQIFVGDGQGLASNIVKLI